MPQHSPCNPVFFSVVPCLHCLACQFRDLQFYPFRRKRPLLSAGKRERIRAGWGKQSILNPVFGSISTSISPLSPLSDVPGTINS